MEFATLQIGSLILSRNIDKFEGNNYSIYNVTKRLANITNDRTLQDRRGNCYAMVSTLQPASHSKSMSIFQRRITTIPLHCTTPTGMHGEQQRLFESMTKNYVKATDVINFNICKLLLIIPDLSLTDE